MRASLTAVFLLLLPLPNDSNAEPRAHRVEAGDTLWAIAEAHYGNRHYSRVLAAYHERDGSQLRVGETITLPSFREMLVGAGTESLAPEATVSLARGWKSYRDVAPRLVALRKAARARGGERQERNELPPEMVAQLESVAADLANAASRFESVAADEPGLARVAGQLRRGAAMADKLSTGANDGYSYDIDMVDQHISYATTYLFEWLRLQPRSPWDLSLRGLSDHRSPLVWPIRSRAAGQPAGTAARVPPPTNLGMGHV